MVSLLRGIIVACLLSVSASAQVLSVANGGTGSNTQGGARSALGLGDASTHAASDFAPASAVASSGMVMFVSQGTCPTGWTEVSAYAGLNIVATTHAAGDVGTTGGSSSYTPTGTNGAPTFTGTQGTVAAQTFTGDTTTVPAQTINSLTAAAQSFAGDATTVPAETVNSLSAAAQTVSWPVNVPTHTGTAASFGGTAWSAPALSWPVNVPAFNGASTTVPALAAGTLVHAHTHPIAMVTAAETAGSGNYVPKSMGGTTLASGTTSVNTGAVSSSAVTGSTATGTLTPLGAVAWPANPPTIGAYTPGGSVTLTNQGTVAWPANPPTNGSSSVTGTLNSTSLTPLGHNTASSVTGTLNSTSLTPLGHNGSVAFTPAGTVAAPTFTGAAATITPPYVKLIPCSKN